MPNNNLLQGLNIGTDALSGLMQGSSGSDYSGVGKAAGTGIGAAIGSVVPGLGTMLGASIGGMAGNLFGGLVKTPQQKRTEALQDNAIEKMNLIAQRRRDNAMQNDLIAQNTIFQSF